MRVALLGLGCVGLWLLSPLSTIALAETPAVKSRAKAQAKSYGNSDGRAPLVSPESWGTAKKVPLRPGEIDQLLATELHTEKITPAPLTTDEEFLRRVSLDLTGHLPLPADVDEFVADNRPNKRAKLIDRLLDSEEYARHWAQYWRDVISAQATVPQPLVRLGRDVALETWLFEEIKANRSWADMARAMITAEGNLQLNAPETAGPVAYLLGHMGPDADNERAAETARLFLGIQIQCAQCHDHPSDIWKRNQFHELAAYFGRTRERQNAAAGRGLELVSAPQGEHRMPSLDDPKKSTVIHPRFLSGAAIPPQEGDKERRRALAQAITSKENYWFAAAYVNRIWGVLMGQSFYQPVDDMGPKKEVVFPSVLIRLAASFQAENYDTKSLIRAVLNSEAYQREIRLGDSAEQHLRFAAACPTRLRPDALWQALVNVLGAPRERPPQAGNVRPGLIAGGLAARLRSFEAQFKREFNFDPSLKADEVEGSIPQALLLMNNSVFDQRIQAKGTNFLSRILKAYPNNEDAVRILYLRTLARKPTSREQDKCQQYIARVGNRTEAFEDLLWALINSTEFLTKR
ncbi:MAG TPA: DUF1549 domain-containing protein [Gemmataceae bacterium]|nr:DUF1549 domain-containing protein [Gemmataceae bacterium]